MLGGGALGGASTGGGGLFAQQAQPKLGGGLFGAQNKLGLGGLGAGTAGAGGGGLFNQQTSQAATAGLFANQATTGGGLFNQQQASTGLGGLGGGLLGQPSQVSSFPCFYYLCVQDWFLVTVKVKLTELLMCVCLSSSLVEGVVCSIAPPLLALSV